MDSLVWYKSRQSHCPRTMQVLDRENEVDGDNGCSSEEGSDTKSTV